MKKMPTKILLVWMTVFLFACGGDKKTSDPGSIFSKDETLEAAKLVDEANSKLKLIKKRFKENEPRNEELKTALKDKDAKKVRELSLEFENQIRAGSEQGAEAIDKLKSAKEMNINADFKEYLQMKISSLEKYVEAFELRRQAAQILGEGYDPKDPAKRDRVIAEFKLKDEKFTEIIVEARKMSEEANDFAKESMRKKN